jgi:phosphoglycerate dehydrogenase-like enzyme
VAYFLKKGVPFANTPGTFSATALAEHALFLMLSLAKNFATSQDNVRSSVCNLPLNSELQGKTLGLIGFGASGRELAKRAGAMGMRILATDAIEIPQVLRDQFGLAFVGRPDQLEHVLVEADYVSLHTPLTSKTRHLMNRRAFELMKPTAVLINVARGAIVDEAALIEALRSGRIAGAGLDVFAQEPIDPAHPLLHMGNVVFTPHIAGVTAETRRRRGQAAAENVSRIAQGLPPLYQVTSADLNGQGSGQES